MSSKFSYKQVSMRKNVTTLSSMVIVYNLFKKITYIGSGTLRLLSSSTLLSNWVTGSFKLLTNKTVL